MLKAKYFPVLFTLCALMGALVTTSCADPKRSLGLNRTAPDEFTVISHAPLTMPPDYNLTPSSDVTVSAKKPAPVQTAQGALFSSTSNAKPYEGNIQDTGANVLLRKAGASPDNVAIRDTIAKEGAILVEQDKEFTDKLVFWRDGADDPTSFVVDAEKETRRLQGNQALGKPVTEGDTPYIARKKKALLEFN